MQVYVSAAKRAVLDTLGLGPEYTGLLTSDERAARLHAVPLWRVSLKHMGRVLRHFRGRFNTVVGFQPTGWCMRTGGGPSGAGTTD
jgi:DNA cross-link repair 1A protein